jgi:S-layer protein
MAVAQDYVAVAQQLYVSYFGRPADYFGLQNFSAQLAALNAPTTIEEVSAFVNANKTSALANLVNSFNSAPESVALYGTDTTQVGLSKFVEAIYLNVLGRAPDVDGWNYWIGEIASGRVTRAAAAVTITEGALKNTTPQGLLDAQTVKNKVAVATSFTAGLDQVAEINAYTGDAAAATARGLLANVNNTTNVVAYQSTVNETIANVVAGAIPGSSKTLTTAVETLIGTNGNDTFSAIIDSGTPANTTLNTLDSIDGGAGVDTLSILNVAGAFTALPAGVTLTNIENVSIRSAGAVTIAAVDAIAGISKLIVAQATTAAVNANATTAVEVSGVTAGGAIAIDGGSSQAVTSSGSAIVLGATTATTGAVAIIASNQAAATIAVDGGNGVSITTTGVNGAADITVGAATAAKGVVTVSATGAAATGTAAASLGAITITGGTKISAIQNATSDASKAATDIAAATTNVITEGAVSITGTTGTTEVVVQQTATTAGKDAVLAVAGSAETQVITFKAMTAGQTVTINGLVFTAAKALTAAEAAAAFAGVAAGSVQGNAVVGNGFYTGTFSGDYSFGAASGATVTLTAETKSAVSTFAQAASGTALTVVGTAGVTEVKAVTGALAVAAGAVTIAEGTGKLATVTVDGYDATTIASNSLTALNLANSDAAVTVTNTTATNLALGLKNVGVDTAAAIGLGGVYTNLNVTTATADSKVNLTAGGVKTLTVGGTNALDLSGSTLGALTTLTVTGAAGVTAIASGATVTAVNTSASTGTSTIEIDGSKATYTGGAGVDVVTTTVAPTKAINLGAGNDVLKFAAGVTSATSTLNGGDGIDTIEFNNGVDAAAASGNNNLASKLVSFERVGVATFAANATVDLANLNNINYVVVGGSTGGVLTLDNLAANSTVELTGAFAAATGVTAILDDATGTADVLNVVLTNDADVSFGKLTAAGVETINVSATNTDTEASHVQTLEVVAAAAKSIVITGNADVDLTTGLSNAALTSIDGSALTGALTAGTSGAAAVTIRGGAGDDVLTTNGTGDTLIGGAGNDTLIVNGNLATLTGGAGVDTFNVAHATTNVNNYATITDIAVGDIIKFADTASTESFQAAKVVLGSTAVFQDYANAAIQANDRGAIAWFQVGGDTYIVEHASADASTSFVNGTDIVVKLTGLVDLSKASFSADHQTLVITA